MEPVPSETLQDSGVPSLNSHNSGAMEGVSSENLQSSGAIESITSENLHNSGEIKPTVTENLHNSTTSDNLVDQNHANLDSNILNNGNIEPQHELKEEDMEAQNEFKEEDIKHILELIASTGKFWLDWEKLKRMLSFYLKQVLLEYPEAKSRNEQQNSSLGDETFHDLVRRLDDALVSFIEGPPFTIQRVCEILLGARNIYPKLSKLALALEKNLLVTSMLSITTQPYQAPPPLVAEEKLSKDSTVENGGIKPPLPPPPPPPPPLSQEVSDADEIMAEVEEADDMTIDMESGEQIVTSSQTTSSVVVPTSNDS